MAGFAPVGSLPVASVPSSGGAEDFNNITSGNPSYLTFQGFLPVVLNNPGVQVEQFSFYRVGSDPASDLQTEQFGAYIIGTRAPVVQVEQFGSYIVGAIRPPLQVEQFGAYLVSTPISQLEVVQFSVYIARSEVSPVQVEQFGCYIIGKVTPLVIPALASSVPETPIVESWVWASDPMISDDGSEQRVSLAGDPKRTFSNKFVFNDDSAIRTAKDQLSATFREAVAMPLHQYGTRLKAAAVATGVYLTFTPTKTDLRNDGWVLIVEGATYELKTVDNLDGTGCSITTPLANSYSTKARVMPVSIGFIDNNAALVQYPKNGAASLTVKGVETQTLTPFLRPGITVELTEFDTLPVLERRAIGTEFNDIYDLGREILEYGGKIEFRQPWNYTRISGEREFNCQRVLDGDDWDYWRVFFDYCRGRVNPFFLPTYREDFGVIDPPDPLDNTFIVEGHNYVDDYFDNPTYKQIAIFAEDGTVHYATISAAVYSGDNDALTFLPALPGDVDWEGCEVCLLLLCRLGTDQVDLEHYSLDTKIKTSIRTVDA